MCLIGNAGYLLPLHWIGGGGRGTQAVCLPKPFLKCYLSIPDTCDTETQLIWNIKWLNISSKMTVQERQEATSMCSSYPLPKIVVANEWSKNLKPGKCSGPVMVNLFCIECWLWQHQCPERMPGTPGICIGPGAPWTPVNMPRVWGMCTEHKCTLLRRGAPRTLGMLTGLRALLDWALWPHANREGSECPLQHTYHRFTTTGIGWLQLSVCLWLSQDYSSFSASTDRSKHLIPLNMYIHPFTFFTVVSTGLDMPLQPWS